VKHDDTVVILSEGLSGSCKYPPRITIRWILAPLGSITPLEIARSWEQEDWVFHYMPYAPGAAMNVPDSNILMVTNLPAPGDHFDISEYRVPDVRKGTC